MAIYANKKLKRAAKRGELEVADSPLTTADGYWLRAIGYRLDLTGNW